MTDMPPGLARLPFEHPQRATWSTWREALNLVLTARHLRATLAASAVVGTVLLLINQLDVALQRQFGVDLLWKTVLTYLVPFLVSNYGLLAATRRDAASRTAVNAEITALTAAQMRAVDRIAMDDLHLDLLQMMENAGRNLAQLALRRFEPTRCVVLAGSGGNGGGGLAAARHLLNRGVEVHVVLATEADRLSPATARQLDILQRMEAQVDREPSASDLIIDALIGYSLSGNPRGRTAELIRWMNGSGIRSLALDTPSGLDVTSGDASDPCVSATATLALGLPKRGLLRAPELVGELWFADIAIPPGAYERIGVHAPRVFLTDSIVRLAPDAVA